MNVELDNDVHFLKASYKRGKNGKPFLSLCGYQCHYLMVKDGIANQFINALFSLPGEEFYVVNPSTGYELILTKESVSKEGKPEKGPIDSNQFIDRELRKMGFDVGAIEYYFNTRD